MNGIPLRTLQDVWRNVVHKSPNKTAVVCENERLTYGEADAAIQRVAAALRAEYGVGRGDRVAVAMPNCLEFYVLYWATVLSGGAIVPVNTRLRADEMRFVVENAAAKVLAVHAHMRGAVDEALAGRDETPEALVAVGAPVEGRIPYERLAGYVGAAPPAPEVGVVDIAVVAYTSGTTGQPKGAIMNHGNILYNVLNCLVAHSFRHEDVHLLVVPMFHCTPLYSLLPSSAYLGSTIVIAPRPNQMSEIAQLVATHRVTTFIGVPTMFHFLVTMKGFEEHDFSSLKMVAYAGAVMPRQTIERLRERFPWVEMRNFFGLTETTSVTHVLPSGDALTRSDSVGKALPSVGVMIADSTKRTPPYEPSSPFMRPPATLPW